MSSRDTASLQIFLDRLSARSVLTDEEKSAILALPTRREDIKARRDFVHLKQETVSSCVIVSGLVARFDQTVEGERQIVAFHVPGDMADLHSAVRPIGTGGLSTMCDSTILHVLHTDIFALCARYPAVAEALWRDCMLDAAVLAQWVVNVGRRNAQTRLSHLFCEMASRYGTDREWVLDFPFQVTQGQLADATGLTAVHVNRTMGKLRLDAVVSHRRGKIKIHDWARLARLGEFDADYLVADTKPDRPERHFA